MGQNLCAMDPPPAQVTFLWGKSSISQTKQVSDRWLSDLSQTTQLVGEILPKSLLCYQFILLILFSSPHCLSNFGNQILLQISLDKVQRPGFGVRQFQVSTTWVTCTTGALRAISVKVS